jgi:phosphomannomutase
VLGGRFTDAPRSKNAAQVSKKDLAEGLGTARARFLSIDTDKAKRDIRIAVDAGNGMAGKIFPELEPYVPWEVDEMYFELDGTFPNHEANPLQVRDPGRSHRQTH